MRAEMRAVSSPVLCPMALTAHTPCVARHGRAGCDRDSGLCAGCGQDPAQVAMEAARLHHEVTQSLNRVVRRLREAQRDVQAAGTPSASSQ